MDWFNNVKDTVRDRIKGAFGGTFILLWFIINWEIVYILFNFDSECTMNDKIAKIEEYIAESYPWKLLLKPMLFTLVSIVVYNVLNSISFTVISLFKLKVQPPILEWLDKDTVVERERHDILEKQFKELNSKYDEEKANFIKNNDIVQNLENENNQLIIKVDTLQEENNTLRENSKSELNGLRKSLTSELDNLKNKLTEKESEVYQLRVEKATETTEILPSVLFAGKWIKTFQVPNRNKGREEFYVEDYKYMVNGKNYFTFEYVKLYSDSKFIEIKKYNSKREVINKLVKISDSYFVGIETDGFNDRIEISYIKVE